jgi:acyl-CoA reductase-like NAD-dependent aldehyde dehydrogenase
MHEVGHRIGGRDIPGQGAEIAVLNPATAAPIATFREATPEQVNAAVAAARRRLRSRRLGACAGPRAAGGAAPGRRRDP